MQISKGVEWAIHAASLMIALPDGRGLKADALARYHGVPAAYMAKQLQAMSMAGLVFSSRGAHGGYRLAKPPAQISLWDLTKAIEGNRAAFRCTEIRQDGPCRLKPENCRKSCPIANAFITAEKAFRASLASVTLADIGMKIMADSTPAHLQEIVEWLNNETGTISIPRTD